MSKHYKKNSVDNFPYGIGDDCDCGHCPNCVRLRLDYETEGSYESCENTDSEDSLEDRHDFVPFDEGNYMFCSNQFTLIRDDFYVVYVYRTVERKLKIKRTISFDF